MKIKNSSTKSSGKIKQFILFGVCSLLALVLCMVVLVVTVNNLEDTKKTEEQTVESLTPLSDSEQVLTEYIYSLTNKAFSDKFVKTNSYTDVSVNDDIIVTSNNAISESDSQLFTYFKNKLLSTVDSYFSKDLKGTFEANNSKKTVVDLTGISLKKATFSTGQTDENGASVYDDSGNLVDADFYYVSFVADGESILKNKELSKAFSLKEDKNAGQMFLKDLKDICKVTNANAVAEDFIIEAKINRTDDKIQYIKIIRNYKVSSEAEFINKLQIFGKKEIDFTFSVTDTYEYSYAGISFAEDEIIIGINEEANLSVNAIIDDDSEYTVEFVSSDENIAVVDEMGYVKGLKISDAPATITVKLNYLGETFTDTCIVNVSEEQGGA